MPQFSYTARDASGALAQGVLEAAAFKEAAAELGARGLVPISLRLAAKDAPAPAARDFLFARPDPLDALLFSQQMGALLQSGVPILRALAGIEESAPNPRFAAAIGSVREGLDAGKPLSACLAKHPVYFSPYYLSMVRVGEMSGSLDRIFHKLHEHLEFQRQMSSQVKAATRYPAMVASVMLGALLVINFFVIPAFAKVYAGFNAQLPIFTRAILGLSSFLLSFWWLIALLAGVGAFFFFSWRSTPSGRLGWDRFILRLPIAGRVVHKAVMARFCRSLALSMASGVPIASAIGLVAESSDNAWVGSQLIALRSHIERGESLHKSCSQSGAFTPIALQMILVGEESGTLERMLSDVSSLYQSQVEYELKTLGAQIEPLLILFMALLVLVLALGVFLPIWNLSSVAFSK